MTTFGTGSPMKGVVSPEDASSPLRTVRPHPDGYMVPADDAGGSRTLGKDGQSPITSRGFGFCCSRPVDPKQQAMSYVGQGGGDYIVETRYRYIGSGAGEFALIDPEKQEEPKPTGTCCWTWCPILIVGAIALLIFGWLFLPEHDVELADIAKDLGVATSQPPLPFEPGSVKRSLLVSMKVLNVDYTSLRGDAVLHQKFITEVQEGVAVVAGSGILPDNVTVTLSPGSVVVHAAVHPPAMVSIGHLRSRLASESEKVGEGVRNSLKMIRNIEDVCTGDLDVVDTEVSLVVPHLPGTATTTTLTATMTATRTITSVKLSKEEREKEREREREKEKEEEEEEEKEEGEK